MFWAERAALDQWQVSAFFLANLALHSHCAVGPRKSRCAAGGGTDVKGPLRTMTSQGVCDGRAAWPAGVLDRGVTASNACDPFGRRLVVLYLHAQLRHAGSGHALDTSGPAPPGGAACC